VPGKKSNNKHLKNLIPAKKGEPSRNPTGKTNPELREIRRLTRAQITDIGSLLLNGSYEQIEEYAEDQSLPAIQYLIARVATRAARRRDHKAFLVLIEQIAGKQIQEVKVQMSAHAALVAMVNEEGEQ